MTASASALADCITVLEGEASELDPRPVWLRVGQHGVAAVGIGLSAAGAWLYLVRGCR